MAKRRKPRANWALPAVILLLAVTAAFLYFRREDESAFVQATDAPLFVALESTEAAAGPTPEPTAPPQPTALAARTPLPTSPPAATAVSNALRFGDEGEKVRSMQQRLKELDYLSGKVDGIFGYSTEEAVKAFQRANGLAADGIAGDRTMEKMRSSGAKPKPQPQPQSQGDLSRATAMPKPKTYTPSEPSTYRFLQLGGSGSDVTRLQNRLIELGYLNQKANGSYDQATMEAVIAFQERNGQWVDGVAGQDTQSMLFSNRALPAAPRRD